MVSREHTSVNDYSRKWPEIDEAFISNGGRKTVSQAFVHWFLADQPTFDYTDICILIVASFIREYKVWTDWPSNTYKDYKATDSHLDKEIYLVLNHYMGSRYV